MTLKEKKAFEEIIQIFERRKIQLDSVHFEELAIGVLPNDLKTLDLMISFLADEFTEKGLRSDSEPTVYGLRVEDLMSIIIVKRIEVAG